MRHKRFLQKNIYQNNFMEVENFIDWLNKKVEAISNTSLFVKYFEKVILLKIEDSFYLTNKFRGIEVVLSINFVVTSIHFFSDLNEETNAFQEELPLQIKLTYDRIQIRQVLGTPNKNGGGIEAPVIGYILCWDKYYFDNFSLHIQYSKNNNLINMVTIASLYVEGSP